MPNYLVVATSGRAIAQGLKSLGHSVYVIDGFADKDSCRAAAQIKQVKRSQFGLDQQDVIRAISDFKTKTTLDGLFYDAALETSPNFLDEINVDPVFGNSSQVLKSCKNPEVYFSLLDKLSIPYPETLLKPDIKNIKKDSWLVKQANSTGGLGVNHLGEDITCSKNNYLQKKINGLSFSVSFLANGEDVVVLGFNTLWSEALNDDAPFAYAGAINDVKLEEPIKKTALEYVKLMAKEFNLLGLNSIDFIFANDSIYVLEINPRIPASYELYETKYGDLMQEHIQVCLKRELPAVTRTHILRAHAIVYAPIKLTVPSNMLWPLWTADRPHAQELINIHEPVCSIFAGGQNTAQVCEMIKTRKQSILAKFTE